MLILPVLAVNWPVQTAPEGRGQPLWGMSLQDVPWVLDFLGALVSLPRGGHLTLDPGGFLDLCLPALIYAEVTTRRVQTTGRTGTQDSASFFLRSVDSASQQRLGNSDSILR